MPDESDRRSLKRRLAEVEDASRRRHPPDFEVAVVGPRTEEVLAALVGPTNRIDY